MFSARNSIGWKMLINLSLNIRDNILSFVARQI